MIDFALWYKYSQTLQKKILTTQFIAIVFCYWWKRMFNQNQFNLNVGMYEKALLQFSYWQALWIKQKNNNVINIILFSEQICYTSDQLICTTYLFDFLRKRRVLCSSFVSQTIYSWLSILSFYSNIILFIDVFSGAFSILEEILCVTNFYCRKIVHNSFSHLWLFLMMPRALNRRIFFGFFSSLTNVLYWGEKEWM